jgi:hypothetical protein
LRVLKDWIFDDERFICIKEILIYADARQDTFLICERFALGVEVGFHEPGHRVRTEPMSHEKGDFVGHLNNEVLKRLEISFRNPAVSQKGHEVAPQRLINLSRLRETCRHL